MKNKKITTISQKYNGTLRSRGEAYLIEETAEAYTLLILPNTQFWVPKRQDWYKAPDGLLQLFFKHKWYNVWHICEQNSNLNLMYINIAMPATLQTNTLTWVDLDLDYRVHLDHSWEQIDQQDFEENKQLMGYPPQLLEQVQTACLEVEAGLDQRTFPFNYEQQVKRYQQFE